MNIYHTYTVFMSPAHNGSPMLGHFECRNHIYPVGMNPGLNGSPTLGGFERRNASEINNGIMFDFYLGLSQD